MAKLSKKKPRKLKKKVVGQKSEENVSMYFRLDYPLEVRKNVLRTAIELTQLL